VVAAGKARIVYLLNGSSLGGIGGQQAQLADACEEDIDGGVAVEGSIVYLPCLSGPIAVQVSAAPAGLHLLWSASVGGGPPVVAAGMVWTIGSNGILYGLNPSSGAVLEHASIGAPANHFPTPAVAEGLLLAPSAYRVVAFQASSANTSSTTTTATAPTTTTERRASATPPAAEGGSDPWVATLVVIGALAVLGALGWYLLRRRRH
jgi:outer membrane protein assembly factor BamB